MVNKKPPTLIITGAGGFVGTYLINYFSKKGWQVIGLVRDTSKFENTKLVQYVSYDMNKKLDDTIFNNANYLVHTAYIKYNKKNPDAFTENLKAARQLAEAANKHKLKHCLFLSSMSAHSDAVSVYGKQKLAIEKIFSGKNFSSIRSGLILGDGGLVKQMVGFVRSKRVVPLIDGGGQPLQIIGIYDLAKVIDKILTEQISGLFTVAYPEVYSYRQFYKAIGEKLGIRIAFVPIPFFAVLTAIRTVNFLHLPLSVGEDNLWGLKKLRSTDNRKDLDKLGVRLDSLEKVLSRPDILKT